MLSRSTALDRGIKLVTGTDAARDRIAVANALYSVQTETALEITCIIAGHITGHAMQLIVDAIKTRFCVDPELNDPAQ